MEMKKSQMEDSKSVRNSAFTIYFNKSEFVPKCSIFNSRGRFYYYYYKVLFFKGSNRLFGEIQWTFLTELSIFKLILVSKEVNI